MDDEENGPLEVEAAAEDDDDDDDGDGSASREGEVAGVEDEIEAQLVETVCRRRERSKQFGASERVSGVSEWTSEWTSTQ